MKAESGTGAQAEWLDTDPDRAVAEAEYRRLLGYPKDYAPGPRARELEAWAREWYAAHGRPWIYVREAALELGNGTLRLDGMEFASSRLREHLGRMEARRAVLAVVSAGAACEEHARRLWEQERPDEYFFLEILGSAVVEQLLAGASGGICARAEDDGLIAVPHYSPGYAGWDVAEQPRLLELIRRGVTRPLPEPLDALPGGMLRPKKSLLAVIGLAARSARAEAAARQTPCARCSFSPCRYRRASYRPEPVRIDGAPVPPARADAVVYTVNPRALEKWSNERVWIDRRPDGRVAARFRFDGTTCSNLGRPLAFDYRVVLGTPEEGSTILELECRPASGDEGHTAMCAWLNDADALRRAWETEQPLLGRPLDAVLTWKRRPAAAGCLCDHESRRHKWGLALEAIHFALARNRGVAPDRAEAAQPPFAPS